MRSISSTWGAEAEKAVRKWFRENGWYVIPLADISTARGGPRAEGLDTSIILDDILAVKDGVSRLVEVKFKDSPEPYRIAAGDLRHGIDAPYWDNYLKLSKESGIPGSLFIIEYKDQPDGVIHQKLLTQHFDFLERALERGITANRLPAGRNPDFPHGGVFWSVSLFENLGFLPRHLEIRGLGDTVSEMLRNAWRGKMVEASRAARGKLCPVCGKPGFLGLASNPSGQFCPDHAPASGFNEDDRVLFRNAIALRRRS